MEPISWIGLGGSLLRGLSNWWSGRKQNELIEKSLRQQAEEFAARKQRWSQEDMARKMLGLDMERNMRARQRKMEEMAPIFDKQRDELEKLNESRFRTSSGEDMMVKANDMRAFLLDMIKDRIEKGNENLQRNRSEFDEIDRDIAKRMRNISNIKF
jgi:hypothetical protein